MSDDEYFPRGGKPIHMKIPKKRKFEDDIFDNKTSKKRSKLDAKSKVEEVLLKNIDKQPVLALNGVREDMIVLSCIRSISYDSLEVELPGFLIAKVKIQNISEPFRNELKKVLEQSDGIEDIVKLLKSKFRIGQHVPFKVTELIPLEHRVKIFGSVDPKDVNKNQRFCGFRRGQLTWGSVKSTSDHGYEIDVGVENCRVFLPFKNMDRESYEKGELIWCSVQEVTVSSTASTLQVSSKHVDRVFTDASVGLNSLLPGTKVQLAVDKHLEHGLTGTFLNNFNGYVNEIFSDTPVSGIDQNEISAYVLYTQEITKITYLTLRNFHEIHTPDLKKGDKLSSRIIGKHSGHLYLKLQGGRRGYAIGSDKSEEKPKYSVGSKNPCVVLDYNRMSRMYRCTLDKKTLKEKYFSYGDFAISELVDGVIEESGPKGLVLRVGQVRGFVPNDHLTDLKYSHALKKKYSVGQRVKTRVLNIKDDNVIFTLKPTFVKNEIHLCDLDQATPDSIFHAMILFVKPYGVHVSFFGEVEGFVPITEFNLNVSVERYQQNVSEFFHRGQIVKVRVLSVKNGSVQASLNLEPPLGSTVIASVKRIAPEGISVEVLKTNIPAFVPLRHLSSFEDLCAPILNTFAEGDKITDLLCISSSKSEVILSRKEKLGHLRHHSKICHIKDVKVDKCIRCFVDSIDKDRVVLTLPIRGFRKKLTMKMRNIDSGPVNLRPSQTVIGKVISVNQQKKEINLTLRFNEIFDRKRQKVLSYFEEYLNDLEYLRQHGLKNGWKISDYGVGEKLSCRVREIADVFDNSKDYLLKVGLPNGAEGVGYISQNNKKPKKGSVVTGVVLGHDYSSQSTELTFQKSIICHIKPQEDSVQWIDSKVYMARKVLTKEDYVLGLIDDPNGQLVYLPTRLNENHFQGLHHHYQSKRFKIVIIGTCRNRPIGVPYKLKNLLKLKIAKARPETSTEVASNMSEEESDKEPVLASKEESEDEPENPRISTDDGYVGATGEEESESEAEMEPAPITEETISVLPPMTNFFTNDVSANAVESSDDEIDEVKPKKKKKKTAAEREAEFKEIEERISKIERELADPQKEPESADQFDRLLLANPNSSALWIKYISFHLSSAEFDKARTIARKALETIDMDLTEEKFNVWLCLLRLENMYGTKDSFERTFEEATRFNDSLKVHLSTLEILMESGKQAELDEKIQKCRSKFKHEAEMWLSVARVYFLLGRFEDARNVKNACFKSIVNMKQQLDLMIKFANMEFKHGEVEMGSAIFETVLQQHPMKINFWITYFNQLRVKNLISDARQVLDRALQQKLNLKSLKTLFYEYKRFEEKYGDEQTMANFEEKSVSILKKFGVSV